MNRIEGVRSEAAVLVKVILPEHALHGDPLEELDGLAKTVGSRIVGSLTQRREQPDSTTYLGKGKLEELTRLVAAKDADVILFDNDLTPGQTRNLEKATDCKVIDRTELILDIFATHAKTHEARLAVELAQLQYSLPRLKRMWSHLSRIEGGIGMRGPGEKQLEVDRRLVEKRINDLRKSLQKIERRKERTVAARRDFMTVSLVGYTNAGKSTLMRRLTEAEVLVQDKLFATLDTRTARWQLPDWGPVLLSDTVGFIRDLPHDLIASFKATLEEARQANLLLHVADASNPAVTEQIASVYEVLEQLGIEEKDTVLVLNKVDAVEDRATLDAIRLRSPNAVFVSARSGQGIEELAHVVGEELSRSFVDVDVETSAANGKLFAYLARHGEILSRRYNDSRVTLHCRLPQRYLGKIDAAETVIHFRGAASGPNGRVDADDLAEREHTDEPGPVGEPGHVGGSGRLAAESDPLEEPIDGAA
ncbi:MAG: GTPase HflX [Planctomycetota bacterium]|nr:MAG: GTPase HflX [Planctomycetota bacterium]